MSADECLTDRDKAVLNQQPDESPAKIERIENGSEDADENIEARLGMLESAIEQLQDELEETRHQLAQERQEKYQLAQRVDDLERTLGDGHVPTDATMLEKYSKMPQDERENLLPSSKLRAVAIYENWDDLAWVAGGERLMETKARANAKNQPSKIKYRLENFFDQDLAWNEIYRAMKAVAKLSGQDDEVEEHTDAQNRLHITGGRFEYHVVPTADNSGTRRVLKEVGE